MLVNSLRLDEESISSLAVFHQATEVQISLFFSWAVSEEAVLQNLICCWALCWANLKHEFQKTYEFSVHYAQLLSLWKATKKIM